MTGQREALRQVCRDHHLGALLEAVAGVAQTTSGRLPDPLMRLVTGAQESLLLLGYADRSVPFDGDADRRSVWRSGLEAKPLRDPADVDLWADRLTGTARALGQYEATQQALDELGDDPGFCCEVVGLLAARAAGRVGT